MSTLRWIIVSLMMGKFILAEGRSRPWTHNQRDVESHGCSSPDLPTVSSPMSPAFFPTFSEFDKGWLIQLGQRDGADHHRAIFLPL